jgi:hypothetical protein
MKLNGNDGRCPDFAGGFKFAAALVVIGLIVAAIESPINWVPMTTLHEVAANPAAAPADTEYFPSGYTLGATEPTSHIEAF